MRECDPNCSPFQQGRFCTGPYMTPDHSSDLLCFLSVSTVGAWWTSKPISALCRSAAAHAWHKGKFPSRTTLSLLLLPLALCQMLTFVVWPWFGFSGCEFGPNDYQASWQLCCLCSSSLYRSLVVGFNRVHWCCSLLVPPSGATYLVTICLLKALLHLITLISSSDGSCWEGPCEISVKGKIGWSSEVQSSITILMLKEVTALTFDISELSGSTSLLAPSLSPGQWEFSKSWHIS